MLTLLRRLGNIGTAPSDSEPITLETPTSKGEMYTTGRGGSGNMAKNIDPEAARRAQDVVGLISLLLLFPLSSSSLIFRLTAFAGRHPEEKARTRHT